jgi:hypothetical protein
MEENRSCPVKGQSEWCEIPLRLSWKISALFGENMRKKRSSHEIRFEKINAMENQPKRNDETGLWICAAKNAVPPPGRKDYPRWACVRDLFEVDHKTAVRLCHEAGLHPYEYLDGPVCDVCPGDGWEDA